MGARPGHSDRPASFEFTINFIAARAHPTCATGQDSKLPAERLQVRGRCALGMPHHQQLFGAGCGHIKQVALVLARVVKGLLVAVWDEHDPKLQALGILDGGEPELAVCCTGLSERVVEHVHGAQEGVNRRVLVGNLAQAVQCVAHLFKVRLRHLDLRADAVEIQRVHEVCDFRSLIARRNFQSRVNGMLGVRIGGAQQIREHKLPEVVFRG